MKENSKALGKGLKALIRERVPAGKDSVGLTDAEVKAQNMEFYGSLMKQYVSVGEGDKNTEELLLRIRQHLGIGEEEHEHLVHTLRKRDTIDPNVSEEELYKAQREMKQELKQLFMEFKEGGLAPPVEERNSGSGGPLANGEVAIPLPERTSEMVRGMESTIKAPPVEDSEEDQQGAVRKRVRRQVIPMDLDERAGIIHEGEGHGKVRVDWLDNDRDRTIPMPPAKGIPDTKDDERMTGQTPTNDHYPDRSGDMFEDLGEVPDSGPPVQAINVVKGSEVLREMLDEEGIEAVKPLVKGELRDEVEQAVRVRAAPQAGPVPEPKVHVVEDSPMSLRLLMEEERFAEALDMSERLLSKDPDSTSVLNERGFILFNLGRTDEALETYKGLLSRDPDSVEAMVNYAQVLSSKGRLDESLKYLDLAVKKDPYSEDAWNNKAVVLSRYGRLREALICLDEAVRINDRSLISLMNTGVILERMGEYGPALEAYKTILDLDPGNAVAKQGLDTCSRQIGQ